MGEGHGVLDPVTELDVAQMVEQVAELELHALVDVHGQNPFAMLIFSSFKQLKELNFIQVQNMIFLR